MGVKHVFWIQALFVAMLALSDAHRNGTGITHNSLVWKNITGKVLSWARLPPSA